MNAALPIPERGTVFGDFIVDDTFLQLFRYELAKFKPEVRINPRTGRASRFTRVKDVAMLRHALWLCRGNASAAGRLAGFGHKAVLRYAGQITGSRRARQVSPEDCAAALSREGSWKAAEKSLGLNSCTFHRKLHRAAR